MVTFAQNCCKHLWDSIHDFENGRDKVTLFEINGRQFVNEFKIVQIYSILNSNGGRNSPMLLACRMATRLAQVCKFQLLFASKPLNL